MGTKKRTADEIKKAIKGSGAIKSAIATRLGITRATFDSYLESMPTVKRAFEEEEDANCDVAESVVVDNIRIARRFQTENKTIVDAADAKWYLTKKGKRRGYGDAVEVSGPNSGPIAIQLVDYRATITETED